MSLIIFTVYEGEHRWAHTEQVVSMVGLGNNDIPGVDPGGGAHRASGPPPPPKEF